MIKLLPCPFCGDPNPSIERYGNARVSTIYRCENCGCNLETGEEFNHGERWNQRWDGKLDTGDEATTKENKENEQD